MEKKIVRVGIDVASTDEATAFGCQMLFGDASYFDHKFPEPQYLGAKHIHRSWIAQFVPDEATMYWTPSQGPVYSLHIQANGQNGGKLRFFELQQFNRQGADRKSQIYSRQAFL